MSYLQTKVLTHQQKVCRLYKRSLRLIEDYIHHRPSLRYQAVILRQRFDENRDTKDMVKAKELLEVGESEAWAKQHYKPKKFTHSSGGVAYERTPHCPDWVLDFWHPLEKAQYPKYFATREKRKLDYMKLWDKKYGSSEHKPKENAVE